MTINGILKTEKSQYKELQINAGAALLAFSLSKNVSPPASEHKCKPWKKFTLFSRDTEIH